MAACRMSETSDHHIPVLLKEAVDNLVVDNQMVFMLMRLSVVGVTLKPF